MTAAAFIDTNIFIYAASAAAEDQAHRRIAQKLIAALDFAISAQVLQEFADATLRKKRLGVSESEVRQMIHFMSRYPVAAITRETVLRALDLRLRFKTSYWDASILAAALGLGCKVLYTEDLSHGQDYEGIRVLNPFR
ncbi:MAG: PIN domain-containing protein [Verrucomicrobiota bacterium]|jgi:predicted nucleic acid-binding protein